MLTKVVFALLMSFATASMVTLAQMVYKDIPYDMMLDTYVNGMKVSWIVVFICILLITPVLQKVAIKLTLIINK
jgi:uncharacterized membrane protein YdbT with pleckstrin-like domain